MPSGRGTIHVDKTLTDFSLRYKNGAHIADEVAPRLKVKHESDKYFFYGREFQRNYKALRANGADGNRIRSWTTDTATYTAEEYELNDVVTARDRDNADEALNPDMDTTQSITEALSLAREIRVATAATTQGNYAATNRVILAGVQQWNNAGFTPTHVVNAIEARIDVGAEAIRRATGVSPTHVIIPAAVAKVVKKDAAVRDLVKYTHSDLLVNGDLPQNLWNMKVLIPGAIQDSAAMGQTFSSADVWGKHVVMFHRANGQPMLKTLTYMLTFMARALRTRKWLDNDKEGDVISVSEIVDEKFVAALAGYFIENAIA